MSRWTHTDLFWGLRDLLHAWQRRPEVLSERASPSLWIQQLPYAALGAVHADPMDSMPRHEDHALLRRMTAQTVDVILAACGPGSNSPQTIAELRPLAACSRSRPAKPLWGTPPSGSGVAPWSTGGQMPNFAASADPGRPARCYNEDAPYS